MMTIKQEEVVVADFKICFNSMIISMIKWALAVIPAMIILVFAGMILNSIFRRLPGAFY